MTIRLKKRDTRYFVSLLLVFRYLIPYYFDITLENYQILESLIAVLPLVVGTLILLSGYAEIRASFLPFFLLYFCYVVSTHLNGNGILSVSVHSLHVLLLCLVTDKLVCDKRKIDSFLLAVRDLTLIFFVINFVSTLLYPAGIPSITTDRRFPNFLYGNVNSTIKYIFPGLSASCILDSRRNKKVSNVTLIFILGVIENSLRIYMTATAVGALLFLAVWILFYDKLNKMTRWVYLAVIFFVAVFELTTVIAQDSLSPVRAITSFFGKSADFSGRARLWRNGCKLFLNQPWIGYGYRGREFYKQWVGNASGSHNYYLDVAIQRGIFGELILLGMIIAPFFKMRNRAITRPYYILAGLCCACYLMFLVEPFNTTEYLIIPIIFLFYSMSGGRSIVITRGRILLRRSTSIE